MSSTKLKGDSARTYYTELLEALVPSTVTIEVKHNKDGSFTCIVSGYGTAQEYMPSAIALKAAIRAKLEQDSPGELITTKVFCAQLGPFADFKKKSSASTYGVLAHGVARALKTNKKSFGFEYACAANGFITATVENAGFDWDWTLKRLREIEPVFCRRIPKENDFSDANEEEEDDVDRALEEDLFGEYEEEETEGVDRALEEELFGEYEEETAGVDRALEEELVGECEEKQDSPEDARVDSGLPSPIDPDDTFTEATTNPDQGETLTDTAAPATANENFTDSTPGEADPLDSFDFTDADADLWSNEDLVQSTAEKFQWSGDSALPSLDCSVEEADAALNAFVDAGLTRCSGFDGHAPDSEPLVLGDDFDLYGYLSAPLNNGADAVLGYASAAPSVNETTASPITTSAAGQKRKHGGEDDEVRAQSYQASSVQEIAAEYCKASLVGQKRKREELAQSLLDTDRAPKRPRQEYISPYSPLPPAEQAKVYAAIGKAQGVSKRHTSSSPSKLALPAKAQNEVIDLTLDSAVGSSAIRQAAVTKESKRCRGGWAALKLLNTLQNPAQTPQSHAQFMGTAATPILPPTAFSTCSYPGYVPLNAVNGFQPQPYFDYQQPNNGITNPLHKDYRPPAPVWPYPYSLVTPVDRALNLKRKAEHHDSRSDFKRVKSMLGQSVMSADSEVIDLSGQDSQHVAGVEKAPSNGQTAPNADVYTDDELEANLAAAMEAEELEKTPTYAQTKVPKVKGLTKEEEAAAMKAWTETRKQLRPSSKRSGPPEVLPPFSKVNIALKHFDNQHNMIVEQVQSAISADKASLNFWRPGEQEPYFTIATGSIKDLEYAMKPTELVLSREGEKNLVLDFGQSQINSSVAMHYMYHTHLSPLGNDGRGTDSTQKKSAKHSTKKTVHNTNYSVDDIRQFWVSISRDHVCNERCDELKEKKKDCKDWSAISKKDLKEWTRWVDEVYPSVPFHGMSNSSKTDLQVVIGRWIQTEESYAEPSTLSGPRASLQHGLNGGDAFTPEVQQELIAKRGIETEEDKRARRERKKWNRV